MAWKPVLTELFNRADAGYGSVGNSWVDATTAWSIVSNKARGKSGASANTTNWMLRPIGENVRDCGITYRVNQAGVNYLGTLRRNDATNTGYVCDLSANTGLLQCTISILRLVNGSYSSALESATFAYSAGVAVDVAFKVTGDGTTSTLTCVVTKVSDSSVLASISVTDTTAVLQGAGQIGLGIGDNLNTLHDVDQVTVYSEVTITVKRTGPTGSLITVSSVEVDTLDSDNVFTLEGKNTNWSSGGGGTVFAVAGGVGASIGSQSIVDADEATIHLAPGSSLDDLTLSETTGGIAGADGVLSVVVATISVSPDGVLPSLTHAPTITVLRSHPLYAGGGPYLTLSVGLATKVSETLTNAWKLALVIDTSATPGVVTVTEVLNGTRTAEVDIQQYVEVTAQNFVLGESPGNWEGVSGARQTNNSGAYRKFRFTGTSLQLIFDVAGMSGINPGEYPVLMSSVDRGSWAVFALTSSTTSRYLAQSLEAGEHTLELWVVYTSFEVDRWDEDFSQVKITRVILDSGGELLAPVMRARKWLWLGDSISEGSGALANDEVHSYYSWVRHIMEAFEVEIGFVAFSGAGIANTNNSPTFATDWQYFRAGHSRLVGGRLLWEGEEYEAIAAALGTNDWPRVESAPDPTVPTTNMLTGIRAASTARLLLVPPWGGSPTRFAFDELEAGFAAYLAASADSKAHFVDCGEDLAVDLSGGGASQNSGDGFHPLAWCYSAMAAIFVAKVRPLISAREDTPSGSEEGLVLALASESVLLAGDSGGVVVQVWHKFASTTDISTLTATMAVYNESGGVVLAEGSCAVSGLDSLRTVSRVWDTSSVSPGRYRAVFGLLWEGRTYRRQVVLRVEAVPAPVG